MLDHHRFRVQEACDAATVLRIARTDRPDLILLETNLPDIDGFEVCRQLRADPVTAMIPVVHIGDSSEAERFESSQSGAQQFVARPIQPDDLLTVIEDAMCTRCADESALVMAREWQATFDAISDGIAVVDGDGRIQRCNETLGRLLEREVTHLRSARCYELWGSLPKERQPYFRACESKRRETLDLEYHGRHLRISVDPVFNDFGNVTGAVQIVSDITERRQLEEQFRESQKFETIGTLAAGVAHDFNNLLTSIMGNASLVLGDLPTDSPLRERLDDVVRSSQRAADLTRQLLAYSGKGRHYMQKVELSGLVRHIDDLIESAIPKKVALELRLAAGLPLIEADTNQLQQIVLNLVSNAAEAIGDDAGAISIATGLDHSSVYLEVRDTGCGMEPEMKSRIFDPFFTTKFTGRGLGLAAVAGIVRTHKGSVQVNSAPGQGSTFRVFFPAAEEPSQVTRGDAHLLTGYGTILVVDDEEMVRRIAQASLEVRGYSVILANNGLQAIRQVKENPNIDLVLLDLTMPIMGGEEAIDQILEANPKIRVIVSTGYDHQEAVSRFSRKMVAGYLQKPYTSRQLTEKIQSILTGRPSGAGS
jgi:PAS domain S-box-containing protein